MKVTLYMAVSINGFITQGTSNTDWVSDTDWKIFNEYIKSNDATIMGRKTMDTLGNDFPIEGSVNIVLSKNKSLHKETDSYAIIEGTPQNVVAYSESKGFNNLLLIGGEDVNGQFLKESLIDEIVLSVHPLIIGDGLHLFGRDDYNMNLELIGTKEIDNELVQIRYKVL